MKKAIISLCVMLLAAQPVFPANPLISKLYKEPIYLCDSRVYYDLSSRTFYREPKVEVREELEINKSDNFFQKFFKKTYNLSCDISKGVSFLKENVDEKTTFNFLGGEFRLGYNGDYRNMDYNSNSPDYTNVGFTYQKPIDFSFDITKIFSLFRKDR